MVTSDNNNSSSYNSKFIDGILGNPRNEEQALIVKKWPNMVNRVLSVIESALPEGKQCSKLKKALNVNLYDTRNNLLAHFLEPENSFSDNTEGYKEKISVEFEIMNREINMRLDASLSYKRQRDAVFIYVNDITKEVCYELLVYFNEE